MLLNKVSPRHSSLTILERGRRGGGPSLQRFLWPRCSRPATPAPQQSSRGCSGGTWTAHDGCLGRRSEKPPFFLLQPDPVLDGEELNGQVVPDVLHALAQGDVTLHHSCYTVQLSRGSLPVYARNNWFWSCVWASNACGVVESVLALLSYR